jgi:hypothetical protein
VVLPDEDTDTFEDLRLSRRESGDAHYLTLSLRERVPARTSE